MHALAIDYGDRHIGLAITSDDGVAMRHTTIEWDGHGQAMLIQLLLGTIQREGVTRVAVGVPRNLDGEFTQQSVVVQEFAQILTEALPEDVSLDLVDETLTSAEARERLNAEGVTDSEEHAEAAKIILEDFLRNTVDS